MCFLLWYLGPKTIQDLKNKEIFWYKNGKRDFFRVPFSVSKVAKEERLVAIDGTRKRDVRMRKRISQPPVYKMWFSLSPILSLFLSRPLVPSRVLHSLQKNSITHLYTQTHTSTHTHTHTHTQKVNSAHKLSSTFLILSWQQQLFFSSTILSLWRSLCLTTRTLSCFLSHSLSLSAISLSIFSSKKYFHFKTFESLLQKKNSRRKCSIFLTRLFFTFCCHEWRM